MPNPCFDVPVPAIFVGKAITRSRIGHFMINKYIPLCNAISKELDTRFLFFSATDFDKMMSCFFDADEADKVDGLRIYIADYSSEGKPFVPKGHGGKLTLIFSPTKNDEDDEPRDVGKYYSVPPGKSFDPDECELETVVASDWVFNYEHKKLVILKTTTIDNVDDTKAIHFTKLQIDDLIKEIDCQKATGIKIYFGSVDPDDENDDSPHKTKLLLQFVLTERVGSVEKDFHIEDRDGFDERPVSGDFDTGNPCPPAFCNSKDLPLP
jgi:hypothetical protein